MLENPTSILQSELADGENLLWAGRPKSGYVLRSQDILVMPFGLFFLGFSIFWMVMASIGIWQSGEDVPMITYIFPLFGLPFVAGGCYIAFGRFYVEKRQRAKTFYGVTSERIIIRSGLFSQRTQSIELNSVPELGLTEKADRSGTVSFTASNPVSDMFRNMQWWPGISNAQIPSFDHIPEAKKVYETIRTAIKENR